MPLPRPRGTEKRRNFVSRCLSSKSIKKDFGKGTDQAQAVCFSRWRKFKN